MGHAQNEKKKLGQNVIVKKWAMPKKSTNQKMNYAQNGKIKQKMAFTKQINSSIFKCYF